MVDDSKTELAIALLKGAVSAVPFVGGVIAEVGDLYLNPLEKRKATWTSEIATAVAEIEEKYSLVARDLQDNDEFISFLYQATRIAIKNHQKEKIESLRNAIVSSTAPNGPPEDLKFQYLRYVDELSPTHIKMLTILNKHAGQFARFTKLEQVFSKLKEQIPSLERGTFRTFLGDLSSRHLVLHEDLEELQEHASHKSYLMLEKSKERPLEITPLGRNFITFIHAAAL